MKKVNLSQRNKHERKTKGHIVFANGVEVKLPRGFAFDDRFEIHGIVRFDAKNDLTF